MLGIDKGGVSSVEVSWNRQSINSLRAIIERVHVDAVRHVFGLFFISQNPETLQREFSSVVVAAVVLCLFTDRVR